MHGETFGAVALGALLVAVIWYARRARRAIDLVDELDILESRVRKLETHLRLTAGRLNRLDPPRAGTGNGAAEEPPVRPRTRSDLFRELVHRSKGGS